MLAGGADAAPEPAAESKVPDVVFNPDGSITLPDGLVKKYYESDFLDGPRLTTLTKETFIPGFLERDEGEREPPYDAYPWDGVSGVRPYRQTSAATVVGVY